MSADHHDDGGPATDRAGAHYGPYRVGELIGEGSMASVSEAVDVRTGQPVAVKVLRPHLAENSEVVARFVREGRTLQNLENPNIVRVLDHGITPDGDPWMAMERLRGGSLHALIRAEGALAPERAIRFASDVANALAAVHAHGVIHRDIKPENIFVVDPDAPWEVAKLIDFGVARVTHAEMGAQSVSHTRVGVMLGTAAFMAPEQATGVTIDARADVFSLAVTLYEMLSGKLPYEGETIQAQLRARLEGKIVPIERRLGKGAVPPALADLLDRSLSRTPDRRPANGQAMLRELQPFLVARPTAAPPTASVPRPRADAPSPPQELAFASGADGFTLKRRSNGWVVVLALAVVGAALLSAATFAALRALRVFDP